MHRFTRFGMAAVFGAAVPLYGYGELRVVENQRTVTHACGAGERVEIVGNENTVQLTGPCGAISIAGNRNTVAIASAKQIATPGNENTVSWSGGAPQVSNAGLRNQLSGAARAANTSGHHSGARGRATTVADGAGNSVKTNSDGSTVITDAAGNRIATKPQ